MTRRTGNNYSGARWTHSTRPRAAQTPRLLPDFAANSTPAERAAVRSHWRSLQPAMFDPDEERRGPPADPCAVCASTGHVTADCPFGEAPTLS